MFLKIAGNGRIKGGITGVGASSPPKKVWTVFEALGDISFSYPYSLILLEIQVQFEDSWSDQFLIHHLSHKSLILGCSKCWFMNIFILWRTPWGHRHPRTRQWRRHRRLQSSSPPSFTFAAGASGMQPLGTALLGISWQDSDSMSPTGLSKLQMCASLFTCWEDIRYSTTHSDHLTWTPFFSPLTMLTAEINHFTCLNL